MTFIFSGRYKKIYKLVKYADPKKLIFIAVLLFFQTALELIGVGSFFPYVQILQDPQQIEKISVIRNIYHGLNFHQVNSFYLFFGVFIFSVISIRGLLILLNYYVQGRFVCNLRTRMSVESIKYYLGQRYPKLIAMHSGQISKNIILEVNNAVSVVTQVLQMLMAITTASSLLLLLLSIEPIVILSVGSLFISVLIFISFCVSPIISRKAHTIEKKNRGLHSLISDVFKSVKDIKVYGASQYFIKIFKNTVQSINDNTVTFSYISNFPGVILNVITFGLLIFIVLSILLIKGDLAAALPTIAVIGLASQRMLPLFTQIYNGVGIIKQYEPAVDILEDIIVSNSLNAKNIVPSQQEPLVFQDTIKVKDLSFSHSVEGGYLWKDFNFSINKKKIFCIIGKSGVGKTTFIDILLGLFDNYQGEIWVDDIKLNSKNIHAFKKIVGYVPQFTSLIDASIKENIAFGLEKSSISIDKVMQAAKLACIADFIETLPDKYETVIGEHGSRLSGGQRQRLGIARAMYRNPDLLILDEPTSSLDPKTEKIIVQTLIQLSEKTTIILVTHKKELLEISDACIEIVNGVGNYSQKERIIC